VAGLALRFPELAYGLGLISALVGCGSIRHPDAAGRPLAAPRLGMIDTQAIKGLNGRGARGYDAGKRGLGRKRVALVDANGNGLAVAVVPASGHDRDTLPALDAGKKAWPSLRVMIDDRAFAAARCREWSNWHGLRHHVVTRDPAAQGFVVMPRRGVVERRFGWLSHWGGLLRDRAARLALAAILAGVEARSIRCQSAMQQSKTTQTGSE
jgi:putative transposase